ncbi:sensor histidine kinase, Cache_1, HAMP and PAS domain-containing [Flammeovirgaceae bacterium 311]|nr:sensor histidine kinase, Cache_1, HAMP and PAS domain-containing [Flammeovirgaceae bacterium 311]
MEQHIFYNQNIDALLNSLPDAVFIGDTKGIKRLNDQALHMMGLISEKDIPDSIVAFVKAFNFRYLETNEKVIPGEGPFSEALRGQRVVTELRHTNHETGLPIFSRCAAAPILENDQVTGIIIILTDITERVIAGNKLQETLHALSYSTQEQEAVLDSIPDGVYMGNQSGIYKVNRPALEMLGCNTARDVQGQVEVIFSKLNARYADTKNPIPVSEDPFSRALRGERVVQEIIITHLKTGKDVYVRCAAAPVYLESKIIGAIAVNSDITDKVLAEQKLQKTLQELRKVNEELEAFTYAVSHDLKSPLGRISGLASLLLISNESQISDKDRYLLQLIVQSSEKLTELVSHLLNLGKIGQTELTYTKIDLTALCKQVLENITPTKRSVKFSIAPNMYVWGDKTLMHSVMQNLLTNAAKYSSKNPDAEVQVGTHEDDGFTLCYVRDNGVGFDMSEADKLFMPFKRLYTGTNFEGTGVGLSTVKRIIERHEGKIWAESKPGEGATFYFSLPNKVSKSGRHNHPLKLPEENPGTKIKKLSPQGLS